MPNSDDVTLSGTGLVDSGVINVKDLGPQIAWRTVFVAEYLGPLIIHPAVYYLRDYIYKSPSVFSSRLPEPSALQTLSLVLCMAHFLKRELETLFVHRFSAATMPATYIIRNSGYYWVLAGANMAYWIYAPTSTAAEHTDLNFASDPTLTAGVALFVIGEAINLYTHVVLANLRPVGTTIRAIPKGFSFDWVTCPNYFWEAVAWVGIALVTKSWSTVLFVAVALFMMGSWAGKKEKRYRKEFGAEYKKKRSVMIPGII